MSPDERSQKMERFHDYFVACKTINDGYVKPDPPAADTWLKSSANVSAHERVTNDKPESTPDLKKKVLARISISNERISPTISCTGRLKMITAF